VIYIAPGTNQTSPNSITYVSP